MPKDKKRKRTEYAENAQSDQAIRAKFDTLHTSKPSAIFNPTGGRDYTLSIALPGSIIANAKNHDQKTYLAGSIARALAVFSVDEVIIFSDDSLDADQPYAEKDGYTAFSDPCHFLSHVLSYLETPPHMRKALFPMHPNLRTAGTLPSLDMPHHVRKGEHYPYLEGVTVAASKGQDSGVMVDVGTGSYVHVPAVDIASSVRLTLQQSSSSGSFEPVAPSTPREVGGYYWGYAVRRCNSLSTVFTECPFDGGYDLSIGTSERGNAVSDLFSSSNSTPSYKHMLIVFGGVAGLETAARNDPDLTDKGISADNVGKLFDQWVNILPGQGSRTIRTEEAIWLGLMSLRPFVNRT